MGIICPLVGIGFFSLFIKHLFVWLCTAVLAGNSWICDPIYHDSLTNFSAIIEIFDHKMLCTFCNISDKSAEISTTIFTLNNISSENFFWRLLLISIIFCRNSELQYILVSVGSKCFHFLQYSEYGVFLVEKEYVPYIF